MPELPDIEAYVEALRPRVVGERLLGIRLVNPFLLRTVDPPLAAVLGGTVRGVARLGKRIVVRGRAAGSDTPYFLVLHLMIAGRLHWKPAAQGLPPAEATKARRPPRERPGDLRLLLGHAVAHRGRQEAAGVAPPGAGPEALAALDPGGMEVFSSSPEQFAAALRRENHTLKRALTDPRL